MPHSFFFSYSSVDDRTSLGLMRLFFDLLTAGKVAMADPIWSGFSTEIYLVLAAIYFAFCYAMSSYSRGLERQFGKARNR